MKRKKWTEEEEQTLLHAYSSFSSSSSTSNPSNSKKLTMILPPVKRQKRFQPMADRVNSLHHLADPSSYPFLWSWRDIAIKIHNMRHQYLNVKHKILLLNNSSNNSDDQDASLDWDRAVDLWPNFLLYKEVFGDIYLDPAAAAAAAAKNHHLSTTDDDDQIDSDDLEEEDEEEDEGKRDCSKKRKKKKKRRNEGRLRWRERLRREERREQEDMEWMERVVEMQMEHEKQAMQMHADACQAQLQILVILVRVVCQFLGPGSSGGDVGLPSHVVENLQQEQQRVVEEEDATESLVGHENGKNEGHSGREYL